MKTTAERLKEGMELRGLRQADLAEITGISKGALSSYISGRYVPKQNNTYLIAKALNVNEAWLMGLDCPMERDDYEDQNIIRFEAELDEALHIIESAGYQWNYSSPPDDNILIIKDSLNQIVSCLQDFELVGRYETLYKSNNLSTDALLFGHDQAFLSYLNSLGYHLFHDDSEHKPFITTNNMTVRLNYNTLDLLKSRLKKYTKALVDSELLKLKRAEVNKELIEEENVLRHLQSESIHHGSQFEKNLNETHDYLLPNAAHERTDIEYTEEDRQADEDMLD